MLAWSELIRCIIIVRMSQTILQLKVKRPSCLFTHFKIVAHVLMKTSFTKDALQTVYLVASVKDASMTV